MKRHRCANVIESAQTEKEESMENPTTIAIDLSKNVFEIAVERQGRICQRKRLNRRQTITFLGERSAEGVRSDDRRGSRESAAGDP